MAAAATTSHTNILAYSAGALIELVRESNRAFQAIKSSGLGVVKENGSYNFKKSVKTAIAYNGRSVSQGGNRPSFLPSTTAPATWTLKEIVVPIDITTLASVAGRVMADTLVTIEDIEKSSAALDVDKLWNENVFGQATGELAFVISTNGSTSMVVDDASRLRVGMYLDLGVTSVIVSDAIITAIDTSTNTVTMTAGTGTILAGHGAWRSDTYGINWLGLLDLINDNADVTVGTTTISKALTTYAGISRATYPLWSSTIWRNPIEGGVGPFNKTMLDATIAKSYIRRQSMPNFNIAFCHVDTLSAIYAEAAVSTWKEAGSKGGKLEIGNGGVHLTHFGLASGGCDFFPDINIPRGVILWLNTKDLGIRSVGKEGFVPTETGGIFRFVGNDAASATMTLRGLYAWAGELVGNPIEHAMTAGIQTPVGLGSY